jgi:hypothetical protein
MAEPSGERAALTRAEAQQRADQIGAFARELGELERDGVLRLPAEDRARVGAYDAALARRLAVR